VGKKNGTSEIKRIAADRKTNVALPKLRYIAEHKIIRKRITAVETIQFLLMRWTVHSISMTF
jgi:hypothetical protein